MTEQETYIAGQKASGIEVGDTVRATRHFSKNEAGCKALTSMAGGHKGQFIDDGAVGVVKELRKDFVWVDCGTEYLGGWAFPYFVLEIVKKASGSKPINTITGESNMKTQEIYSVVVTENEKIKDDNGQIESTRKRVIYSKGDLPAYDEDNAKVQATIAASKVKGDKAIKDVAEVEVKVSRPFCA